MQSMTKRLSALALVFAIGVAGAQPSGPPPGASTGGPGRAPDAPKKSALEEALEVALKNNADLRVAAAKLAVADAELRQARLHVIQKVAAAYAEVKAERAVMEEVERQLTEARSLVKGGGGTRDDVFKAQLQFSEAKRKFDAAERALNDVQGKGGREETQHNSVWIWDVPNPIRRPGTIPVLLDPVPRLEGRLFTLQNKQSNEAYFEFKNSGTVEWASASMTKTDATDKLRQVLQKKATLGVSRLTLAAYLALVRKTAIGLTIHADTKGETWKEIVNYDLEDVTIAGMLQFLEDSLPGHQIIVREYGLLIVPKDKVPAGALTLAAFLRAEPAKATPEKGTGSPGTPK